jgi:hypothetical protein
MNSSTRPEWQPKHIVDNEMAVGVDGRYSGGNQSRRSEFQVIHVRSELTLYPSNSGTSWLGSVRPISETKNRRKRPTSSSRYELVVSNDFTEATLPILRVCRHWPVLASHALTVQLSEVEARNLES